MECKVFFSLQLTSSTFIINIQETAYFHCVKYLKRSLHRWRIKLFSCFFLRRAESISLKGDLKKKMFFSQFSGPRRQIKVAMAMTPERSASSSSRSSRCECETFLGASGPRRTLAYSPGKLLFHSSHMLLVLER